MEGNGVTITNLKLHHGWILAVAFVVAAAIFAFTAGAPLPANAAYPGGNGWIVYEEGNDLWAVSADGLTAPVNLTSTPGTTENHPFFSPDGTQIAFSSDFGGAGSNIWMADFDSVTPSLDNPGAGPSAAVKVTTTGRDSEPSWSPNGTMIVFERSIKWTVGTGVATSLDATGVTLSDTAATFITDGVAAGDAATNTTKTWTGSVASVDSETQLTVTPPASVTWAVDDTYEITRTKSVVYKVVAVASGTESALSGNVVSPAFNDSNPVWSPLGDKIAFQSNRAVGGSNNNNIYTMNTDGTGQSSITDAGAFDDHALRPAWSPDGLRIAFNANEPNGVNGMNIWTVDAADGGNAFNVTGTATAGDRDRSAAWSSDGTKIVFQRKAQASTARNIAVIGIDGSGLMNVTTPAEGRGDHQPNWQPILVGVNDAYAVDEGAAVAPGAPGVLSNDKLFTTQLSGATASLVSGVSNGTLKLNADGSFSYTHNGSETLSDSFTYRPVQNGVNGAVATVSITINPINDPPMHKTGLVDTSSGKWYLYNEAGIQEALFTYGNPGDYPFMGDWDGDGIETPGLYRQSDGFVYLKNTNTIGNADISFFFGNPGDIPIAGDFNGNGFDTVSIYRPSTQTFFIINELGKDGGGLGPAEFSYVFGNPGDKPFVGDFDGDGIETVGLHRESSGLVYYRDEHTTGNAQNQFLFGNPGDRLVAGDWTGDGVFTPALFRPSSTTMFFKYTNTQGNADNQFVPTPANGTWVPVSGTR